MIRCSAPFKCLSHIIPWAKGQRDKDKFTDIYQRLQRLYNSHNSSISSHQRNDYIGFSCVTLNGLLDHFEAT